MLGDMSSHFVLSWGSCWLRPGGEAGPGPPGGSAPTSAPSAGVVLSGVAKMGVVVADLSGAGLQRERLPDLGVMCCPPSESPSTAVEAERPGLPISTNERRTPSCLRSAQAVLGRSPSVAVVAQGEDRAWRKRAGGSPATSSSAVVKRSLSPSRSAARPSGWPWSCSMATRRVWTSSPGSPPPGRLGDQVSGWRPSS